jgi:3'-phosphoadenosine 5'-phosphosulfate sulfotransferase (PAPS reductase)/FAD synthetase
MEESNMLSERLQNLVNEAKDIILNNYNESEPMGMLFSGGKDSTTIAHILSQLDIYDKIHMLYLSTGFETDAMKRHLAKFPTIEWIGPSKPLDEIWKAEGHLPVCRPVSIKTSVVYNNINYNDPDKRYWLYCCYRIRYSKKFKKLSEYNCHKIITGMKAADHSNGRYVKAEVVRKLDMEYISPIYNWVNDDVYEYLTHEGVSLCEDYERMDGMYSCPLCCAYGERNRINLENLKKYYPEILQRYMDAAKYCYEHSEDIQEIFTSWEDYWETWLDTAKYRERVYGIKQQS